MVGVKRAPSKQCPQCNRQYDDYRLMFCLQDGSPLVTLNNFRVRTTEVLPNSLQSTSEDRRETLEMTPLIAPTGALDVRSDCYITRDADAIAEYAIQQLGGVTMTIKGPRQIGKTSLLKRVRDSAQRKGKQVADFDFQMLEQTGSGVRSFYGNFCSMLTRQLGLANRVQDWWKEEHTDSYNCTTYLKEYILKEIGGPLLLAMDEVERISGAGFCDGFFGMLRSWHNERANDRAWKQLDLTLVTAIEPSQLIKNLNQSPFNVGEVIEMEDFALSQIDELNRRYRSPFTAGDIKDLFALLSGHPFLVHQAISLVAAMRVSSQQLFENAAKEKGPFGNHLRSHLDRLHTTPVLGDSLRSVLDHNKCSVDAYARLRSMGLVRRRRRTVVMRCRLYQVFFEENL